MSLDDNTAISGESRSNDNSSDQDGEHISPSVRLGIMRKTPVGNERIEIRQRIQSRKQTHDDVTRSDEYRIKRVNFDGTVDCIYDNETAAQEANGLSTIRLRSLLNSGDVYNTKFTFEYMKHSSPSKIRFDLVENEENEFQNVIDDLFSKRRSLLSRIRILEAEIKARSNGSEASSENGFDDYEGIEMNIRGPARQRELEVEIE